MDPDPTSAKSPSRTVRRPSVKKICQNSVAAVVGSGMGEAEEGVGFRSQAPKRKGRAATYANRDRGIPPKSSRTMLAASWASTKRRENPGEGSQDSPTGKKKKKTLGGGDMTVKATGSGSASDSWGCGNMHVGKSTSDEKGPN